jgi:hypothetical protein
MALSCAIEEAWENIMSAFSAIEQSGRLHGPNSEEVRLAEARISRAHQAPVMVLSFWSFCRSPSAPMVTSILVTAGF